MKKVLLILPFVFCVFGCGTSYQVGINGYSASGEDLQLLQTSSICVVADTNAPNPLLDKEIANKIQKLLNQKGYSHAPVDKANLYLFFEYGIDSGERMTGALPMYQGGGTATASTFYSYGGSSYSTVQTPGYTTYVPYSYTVYTRWLKLSLFDSSFIEHKVDPLWIGTITSSGRSSDLREVINYMLVCAFDHFGENTKKQIIIKLPADDKRVKALTGE